LGAFVIDVILIAILCSDLLAACYEEKRRLSPLHSIPVVSYLQSSSYMRYAIKNSVAQNMGSARDEMSSDDLIFFLSASGYRDGN
jgi:hypothetical protein